MTSIKTKKIPITAAVVASILVTAIGITSVAANQDCHPTSCFEVSFENENYKLKGEAAEAYGNLIGPKAEYISLKNSLPLIQDDQTLVTVTIEGTPSIVDSIVEEYMIDTMKEKSSEDLKVVIGKITRASLEQFFDSNSLDEMVRSELSISFLTGYSDDTGNHGPFNQFLTEEQKESIGKVTKSYIEEGTRKIIENGKGVEVLP